MSYNLRLVSRFSLVFLPARKLPELWVTAERGGWNYPHIFKQALAKQIVSAIVKQTFLSWYIASYKGLLEYSNHRLKPLQERHSYGSDQFVLQSTS